MQLNPCQYYWSDCKSKDRSPHYHCLHLNLIPVATQSQHYLVKTRPAVLSILVFLGVVGIAHGHFLGNMQPLHVVVSK